MGICFSSNRKIYPSEKNTNKKIKLIKIVTPDKVSYFPKKNKKTFYKSHVLRDKS